MRGIAVSVYTFIFVYRHQLWSDYFTHFHEDWQLSDYNYSAGMYIVRWFAGRDAH